MTKEPRRCAWVTADPLYLRYHDEEWGVPVHDDHRLFEMLILEGAQAGLSWLTVLRKREGDRRGFPRVGNHGPPQAGGVPAGLRRVRHRGARALGRAADREGDEGRGDRPQPPQDRIDR